MSLKRKVTALPTMANRASAMAGKAVPMSPIATAIAVAIASPMAHAATFTVSNNNVGGEGSFLDAVSQANAASGADTILFDTSFSGQTLQSVASEVTSIDVVSLVATVVTTLPHGYATSDNIQIAGATPGELNGTKSITVIDSTTFTYVSASADQAATGTITALRTDAFNVYVTDDLTIDGIDADNFTIDSEFTIFATGTSLTVSNINLEYSDNSVLLDVTDSTLNLSNVNIQGNNEGGRIRATDSNVSISNTVIDDVSSGAAISAYTTYGGSSSLVLSNSIINDASSGGIESDILAKGSQTITLNNTEIRGSVSGEGGAIDVSAEGGNLTLNINTGSALIANSTSENGGAINIDSGLYTQIAAPYAVTAGSVNVSISGTTISDNKADEGGEAGGGIAIYSDEGSVSVSITNSIVDNNVDSDAAGFLYVSNNGANTTLSVADSTFSNNESGSGRGVFSINQFAEGDITTAGDVDVDITNSVFSSNGGEDTGGILNIDASSSEYYSSSTYDYVIRVANVDVNISDSYFNNNESNDAGGIVSIDQNAGTSSFTIANSTFSGNSGDADGGIASLAFGYFVTPVLPYANYSFAGYVYSDVSSTVTISDSTFYDTYTSEAGGVLALAQTRGESTVSVSDSVFDSAEAEEGGGGALDFNFSNVDPTIALSGSTFSYNDSGSNGGAIELSLYNGDAGVTVTDSTFTGNEGSSGGAISFITTGEATYYGYVYGVGYGYHVSGLESDVSLTITDSVFDSNSSSNEAGAISLNSESQGGLIDTSISNTIFVDNFASGNGGALDLDASQHGSISTSISGSVFESNSTESDAGAIYLYTYSSQGDAGNDTAPYARSNNNLSISDTSFDGNFSSGSGGAIGSHTGGTFPGTTSIDISSSTIAYSDSGTGGAIFIENYTSPGGSGRGDDLASVSLTVTNSTIAHNDAEYGGTAIYTGSGKGPNLPIDVTLTNTTIANNAGDGSPGDDVALLLAGSSAAATVKSQITINNTVVANSFSDGEEGIYTSYYADDLQINNVLGADLSISNSLIENPVGIDSTVTLLKTALMDDATNLTGVSAMLGELTDNGGTTLTMMPMTGSPLLEAGSNDLAVDGDAVALTVDQTGSARINGPVVDIGAVEGVYVAPTSVDPVVEPEPEKKDGGPGGSLSAGILIAFAGLFGLRRKVKSGLKTK